MFIRYRQVLYVQSVQVSIVYSVGTGAYCVLNQYRQVLYGQSVQAGFVCSFGTGMYCMVSRYR